MYRMPMLIAATTIATGLFAANSFAQNATFSAAPPAELHPPINLDAVTLRAQLTPGQLGLKPHPGARVSGIELPFGLNYNRDTKGLVMPLDQKSEWGVGVGLQINSYSTVELSPSNTLGLQPKRAPGFMLHKKF